MGHATVKTKKTKLGIECNQKWERMPDSHSGKYCNACSKTVVDFTEYSKDQILAYFHQYPGSCGRFNRADIDPSMIPVSFGSARRSLLLFGFLAFLGIRQETSAQAIPVKVEVAPEDSLSKTSREQAQDTLAIDENGEPVIQNQDDKDQPKTRVRRKYYLSWRFPFIHEGRRARFTGCPVF